MALSAHDAQTFERCMAVGGVAVFPADTVYGLACPPEDKEAVRRLYALKRRRPDKPAAVLFFQLELALAALPELGPRTELALRRLLPGPVTALVPNPAHRFALAAGPDPGTLGLRVPALGPGLAALQAVRWPVLQSSANRAGEPDARALDDVDPELRAGVDLVLDGGPLPGTPSTVVDLTAYEFDGAWEVVREGALGAGELAAALAG